jgi:hypothetical protein
MKRLGLLVGGLSCVVVCLVCAWGPILAAVASVLPPSPARSFHTLDLLTDVTDMPAGWHVLAGPSPVPRKLDFDAMESGQIQFQRGSYYPIATHEVFRYYNSLAARADLSSVQTVKFASPFFRVEWATPPGWSYKSPIAEDFRFACAPTDEVMGDPDFAGLTDCSSVARYGEFISVFYAPVSKDMMSFGDIERVLRAIDSKMARYLR